MWWWSRDDNFANGTDGFLVGCALDQSVSRGRSDQGAREGDGSGKGERWSRWREIQQFANRDENWIRVMSHDAMICYFKYRPIASHFNFGHFYTLKWGPPKRKAKIQNLIFLAQAVEDGVIWGYSSSLCIFLSPHSTLELGKGGNFLALSPYIDKNRLHFEEHMGWVEMFCPPLFLLIKLHYL